MAAMKNIDFKNILFCMCNTSSIGFLGMQNSFLVLFFQFEVSFRFYWVIIVIMTNALNDDVQKKLANTHLIQNPLQH